jgi:cation-transporting ATPase 13A1
VVELIKQGRCTLVTTLQMFKILALNCLITAHSLSVLYIDGVKLGDTQATVIGMMIAVCFLFITRAKPLDKLSARRPHPTLFNLCTSSGLLCPADDVSDIFISLLGQFAVHMGSIFLAVELAKSTSTEYIAFASFC